MERIEPFVFFNQTADKSAVKRLVGWFALRCGSSATSGMLDHLKSLGFSHATYAGVSLGVDDLWVHHSKAWLIQDAEQQVEISDRWLEQGKIHGVEGLRTLIDTWFSTSECLKQEMVETFRRIDPSNPVYMMAFSGARGNVSQVHQLVGMRGLMSDPQGEIIDVPIRSNFREGLSLTEYIISCYGARKGVVDTALRTADSGYLTRRLVDVAQHVVVRSTDCFSSRGVPLYSPEEYQKAHLWSEQRLVGRVLARSFRTNHKCVASRNQDICRSLASVLSHLSTHVVWLRSPLTCSRPISVCQRCYGWNLTHGVLVNLGEAVGIIAGQSIGEPGTQLTMRTFHTGGVFTGDIAQQIRAPLNGTVEYQADLTYYARTRHGYNARVSLEPMELLIRSTYLHTLHIPANTFLLVEPGQMVQSKQLMAEVRSSLSTSTEGADQFVYSPLEGELAPIGVSAVASNPRQQVNLHRVLSTGHVWVLSAQGNRLSNPSHPAYQDQDFVHSGSLVAKQDLCVTTGGTYTSNTPTRSHLPGSCGSGKSTSLPNVCHSSLVLPGMRVTAKRHAMGEDLVIAASTPYSMHTGLSIQWDVSDLSQVGCTAGGWPANGTLVATFCDHAFSVQTAGLVTRDFYSQGVPWLVDRSLRVLGSDPSPRIDSLHAICKPSVAGGIQDALSNLSGLPSKTRASWDRPLEHVGSRTAHIHSIRSLDPSHGVRLNGHLSHSPLYPLPQLGYQVIGDGHLYWLPEEAWFPRQDQPLSVHPGVVIELGTEVAKGCFTAVGGVVRVGRGDSKQPYLKVIPGKVYRPEDAGKLKRVILAKARAQKMDGILGCLLPPGSPLVGGMSRAQGDWVCLELTRAQTGKVLCVVRPINRWEVPTRPKLPLPRAFNLLQLRSDVCLEATNWAWFGDGDWVESCQASQLVRGSLALRYRQDAPDSSLFKPTLRISVLGTTRTFSRSLLVNTRADSAPSFRPWSSVPVQSIRRRKLCLVETGVKPGHPIAQHGASMAEHGLWLAGSSQSQQPGWLALRECDLVKISACSLPQTGRAFAAWLHGSCQLGRGRPALTSSIYRHWAPRRAIGFLGTSVCRAVRPCSWRFKVSTRKRRLYNSGRLCSQRVLPRWSITGIHVGVLIDESWCVNTARTWDSYTQESRWCLPVGLSDLKVRVGDLVSRGCPIFMFGPIDQSGQVVRIHSNQVVLRFGLPYLATQEAMVYGKSGDIVHSGDPFLRLVYQKTKTGDIIQGLPKVEQLLEARSYHPLIERVQVRFETYKQHACSNGIGAQPFYAATRSSLSMIQSDLVNAIQRVYQSQGVFLSDRHLEIIVRQMTCRVRVINPGDSDLLPGELAHYPRVEGVNQALSSGAEYTPLILGITKAALDTQSFVSEASFQETTRVLTRAAIRGRIDWLRGIKENVVLGGLIPAGTGRQLGVVSLLQHDPNPL
uniref:RNA polymerase beta'' subunit n=1 Tax=Hormidiella parvula TaxID=2058785 RepID=UPI00286BDDCA|nr:RNA polymerase beta'' subunit [Hormidiella parvula]WKT05945.1 RNA polymerase beta'' subunit [Hormidiella parvula]